jgi:eukaryotic-like serine/threonine-protein kinase
VDVVVRTSAGESDANVPQRYRITALLGEGGMGVVYDAVDEQRGHRVALKTLKQAGPEALYRLKREFRALADISHPNLVQLYDLVVGARGVSYSMEVVEGLDFVAYCQGGRRRAPSRRDDTISNETTVPEHDQVDGDEATLVRGDEATAIAGAPIARFDEGRLRRALPQLVAALRALHDAGLVHRDVKPSNALVTDAGRVVLLDLGLAASRESIARESLQGLVGTVAYMSPEQAAETADVGPASDWYAVGAMLYETLTGRLPHAGKFVEVLVAKRSRLPDRPAAVVAGVPPDLDELCMRLLAIDPAERPSAAEVADAVGLVDRERTGRSELTLAPRFTGRGEELGVLDEAVTAVAAGRAALAWVRGPSGIGKSALIAELLDRVQARRPDAVILRGRCYEQELVPFKAVDGLIDGLSRVWRRLPEPEAAAILPRAAAALQRLFPVLARVPVVADAPPSGESRDPVEARARAFGALREALQRLADRRLVVLFLDDLQWADVDTLHLLADLLRAPDPPRLLLVVSSRSEAPARGLEEAIARMDVEVTRLDLGPLRHDDARRLVAGMLGEAPAVVVERLVREAGGSPFFLGELVRYLQTTGGDVGAVAIGDVVRNRLALLPASARRLLELVAIAGEPLRLRELAAAAGIDAEQVARDVRVLRVDHLVRAPGGRGDERVEPYHDRIRAAIIDGIDADGRRRHHRALALALGSEASPARLARHWAGAGDRPRAAGYARRAADRAIATFDFAAACDLYRMALELGDHDEASRRDLQILLGGALRDAGRGPEAAEQFVAAAAGAEPLQGLELRRRAAEQLLAAGLIERGIEALRAVLAEIDEDLPASDRQALRSFVWSYLRLRLGSLRWKARDPSRIPPRDLFRLDCYITLGLTLGMVDTMTGAMYQAKGLVTALRLGEPSRIFRIMSLYTIFLMAQGGRSLRRGLRMLARCAAIADEGQDGYQHAMIDGLRGFAGYFTGDFAGGAARLVAAEQRFLADTAGTFSEVSSVRIMGCQCLRYRGDLAALRTRFDELVRDAEQRGDQYVKTTMHRAFNVRFLADDDLAGARAGLAAAWWSPPDQGIHLQHWYEVRALAELALYAGDVDPGELAARLQVIAASRLTRVQTVRAEARWVRMRLALAFPGAGWDARREIAGLAGERVPYAAVWAALGRAALAPGEAQPAALAAAADLADRHGMLACAHAARWRLGQVRGDAEGAALVAAAGEGLTGLGCARPERMLEVLAPGFAERP